MVMLEEIAARTGRRVLAHLSEIYEFAFFSRSVVLSLRSLRYLRLRSLYTIVVNQIRYTGLDAVLIIAVMAIALGATVIIQASQRFPKFGIESFLGDLLVLIIAREIGPLATAMIIVSRSGSAIAAEVATQKQNHEIRSLELMGIDTKLYIVIPRIAAAVLSIFSLIVLFDIIAIFGGYLVAITSVYINTGQFFQILMNTFSFEDLAITVIKSVIYGITIPMVCCYYGLKPTTSFQIPIFVSKAVIRSILFVFLFNAMISVYFYL